MGPSDLDDMNKKIFWGGAVACFVLLFGEVSFLMAGVPVWRKAVFALAATILGFGLLRILLILDRYPKK